MKWYRAYSLAFIVGSVSGGLYHKSKVDPPLRKTLLQLTAASFVYTSVGFIAANIIPRFRAHCLYFTLTAFVTSSNFLFTRQLLIEKEWLYRKELSSKQNLLLTSVISGAETGFLFEGILAEGSIVVALKGMGYWTVVALLVQFCLFQVEAWRIRKSLQLYSPELFPPETRSWPEIVMTGLDDLIMHEWEVDRARSDNKMLDLKVIRELDRVTQAKAVLEDHGISYKD